MMKVGKDFYIKCDRCGCVALVEADSLDYETYSCERSMGDEIEYKFFGEICCERCGKSISFNIRGYEYPVGAFNYSDSECYGGTFVQGPSVEIEYVFDDYFENYAYEQFIRAEDVIEHNRERVKHMSSREFEEFVGALFEKMGYRVKITQRTRDGGRDIIATKEDPFPFTLIVECKHWGEDHKVDVSVVRSVYGVQAAEQVNKSIIVTSSKFTRDARKFAEAQKEMMTLWDMDDLLELIGNNYDGEI